MNNCKNIYVKKYYMDEDAWDDRVEILSSATRPTVIINKNKDRVLGLAGFTEYKMRKIAAAGGYDAATMFWDEQLIFGEDFNLKKALKELTIEEIECEALDRMCDLVEQHVSKDEIVFAVVNKRVIEGWHVPVSFFTGCYLKTK